MCNEYWNTQANVSWSIKIKVKGGNIEIVYTMLAYNFKVRHDEDDTLDLFIRIQNSNAYPRELKNWGKNSSLFLPDNRRLCDTFTAENTDLSRNKPLKEYIQYYHFSALIAQNKGYTQAKQKLPQILAFEKWLKELSLIQFWEFTGDEGVTHLLINLKCTVIVAEYGSPIRICHIPWYLSYVKPMSEIPNKRQIWPLTTDHWSLTLTRNFSFGS